MKFRDLPKFTTQAPYSINVDWEYMVVHIESLNNKSHYTFEMEPDFQRGHVWTEEQQIKYVEFKIQGGTGADIILCNCAGWMGSFKGPYQIVDGLQRITAVGRFINNEIKAFGHYFNEFEDHLPSHCEFIWKVNNLETREEILRWYLELNSRGVVHSKEELERVRNLLEDEIGEI